MRNDLDKQLKDLVPLIINEWNARYAPFNEHRQRLEQIGTSLLYFADRFGVEVPTEIRLQVKELYDSRYLRNFGKPPRRKIKQ